MEENSNSKDTLQTEETDEKIEEKLSCDTATSAKVDYCSAVSNNKILDNESSKVDIKPESIGQESIVKECIADNTDSTSSVNISRTLVGEITLETEDVESKSVPCVNNLPNEENKPEEVENIKDAELEIKADVQAETKPESYDPKNVCYEGDLAVYTDPVSGYQYEWNKDKEEWVPRSNVTYGFEDDTHTYTDADGMKFFWDKEKNAWFPKINDDFMARYQMNYGFVDNTTPVETKEPPKPVPLQKEKQLEQKGVKRKPSDPTWFELDAEQNTKVYVSNLPTDTTEEEFVDLMQKCGLVMRDPHTQKMKVKLYTEPGTNYLKGDALCTYIRIESVDLALKLLDGTDFKGKKVKVERAKFEMKGSYDPKLKPKTKKRKEKQKLKKMQEKLFDWRPEKMIGERAKHEKVVIVKNVFDPNVFDEEVGLILEYQQDLREECAKCGEVRKVIIYDRHPEGVAQINMKEPEEADACVTLLNNRWFGKRRLTAEIWDGKTKFKIAETDSEISQRLNKWDKFLEGEADGKEVKSKE